MDGPHEVVIRVRGDRSWCLQQKGTAEERIRATSMDPLSLPAFRVAGEPAYLEATWTDLHYSSGYTALTVAFSVLEGVVPEVSAVSDFEVQVRPQDPDVERRRPQGA